MLLALCHPHTQSARFPPISETQRRKGQNSAQDGFGLVRIASDGQTRNLLGPVEPA